jgi:hypothetical protein
MNNLNLIALAPHLIQNKKSLIQDQHDQGLFLVSFNGFIEIVVAIYFEYTCLSFNKVAL